ncbi:MAG: hypothetical protein H6621_11925 [Halobacteriovoraceae bacterium]|nr:hypothetical protein [Halobacteriovoraceae bacterium]MCB9095769.1 hypothetical protein [Halobacteriovoraceae bacterium]
MKPWYKMRLSLVIVSIVFLSSWAIGQESEDEDSGFTDDIAVSDEGNKSGSQQDAKDLPHVDINSKEVIYKYKSEEYFDFDALQVKGELLTPTDLSSKSNKRVRFNVKDHIRKDFDQFIGEDLIDIH